MALFVAENAFTDAVLTDSAKMGALFSIFAAVPAFLTSRILSAARRAKNNARENPGARHTGSAETAKNSEVIKTSGAAKNSETTKAAETAKPAENQEPTILNQKDL